MRTDIKIDIINNLQFSLSLINYIINRNVELVVFSGIWYIAILLLSLAVFFKYRKRKR